MDDAIERVCCHVYAYCANKHIKNTNRKAAQEDPNAMMLSEKTWENALEGTSGNIFLEVPIFKKYYDHAIFKTNQRSCGDKEDEDSEGGNGYNSIVSGMKHQCEQRKDDIQNQEKEKYTAGSDGERFAL